MYVCALHKSFVEELRRSRAKSAFDQALFALASGAFFCRLLQFTLGERHLRVRVGSTTRALLRIKKHKKTARSLRGKSIMVHPNEKYSTKRTVNIVRRLY